MLIQRDDVDYNEIVTAAWNLLDYVVTKYKVSSFQEFKCPFMKAVAEELYDEVEHEDG